MSSYYVAPIPPADLAYVTAMEDDGTIWGKSASFTDDGNTIVVNGSPVCLGAGNIDQYGVPLLGAGSGNEPPPSPSGGPHRVIY